MLDRPRPDEAVGSKPALTNELNDPLQVIPMNHPFANASRGPGGLEPVELDDLVWKHAVILGDRRSARDPS